MRKIWCSLHFVTAEMLIVQVCMFQMKISESVGSVYTHWGKFHQWDLCYLTKGTVWVPSPQASTQSTPSGQCTDHHRTPPPTPPPQPFSPSSLDKSNPLSKVNTHPCLTLAKQMLPFTPHSVHSWLVSVDLTYSEHKELAEHPQSKRRSNLWLFLSLPPHQQKDTK